MIIIYHSQNCNTGMNINENGVKTYPITNGFQTHDHYRIYQFLRAVWETGRVG